MAPTTPKEQSMSHVFFIPFDPAVTPADEFTLETALSLIEGLEAYNFEDYGEDDEKVALPLGTPVRKLDRLPRLGVPGETARGFEIAEAADTVSVRINAPSSSTDWIYALRYLAALSAHFGSPSIYDEDNDVYDAESILSFDYGTHIEYGIESLGRALEESESDVIGVPCETCTFHVNDEVYHLIVDDDDPVQAFSRMISNVENVDAFRPRVIACRAEDGGMTGYYVVSAGISNAIPYDPARTAETAAVGIDEWRAILNHEGFGDEASDLPEVPYGAFIDALNEEDYEFIDASTILLRAFDADEMKELYARCRS